MNEFQNIEINEKNKLQLDAWEMYLQFQNSQNSQNSQNVFKSLKEGVGRR